LAWHKNTTAPYEWVVDRESKSGLPTQWEDRFAEIPSTSYYSILGERQRPLDVNLASALAISELLSAKSDISVSRDGASKRNSTVPPDEGSLLSLALELQQLKPGYDDADPFVKIIAPILEAVFDPSLKNPDIESKINAGRKRVDIVFSNAATSGFFEQLPRHGVPCRYVSVECKNYSTDPANPEVDQLAGRLDPIRGMFGLLVCRRVENEELLIARCRDALRQGKYILVLEDEDILKLAEFRAENAFEAIDNYLDRLFRQLVS
jgi:hypothetical protein